jgi:hypothetical protein
MIIFILNASIKYPLAKIEKEIKMCFIFIFFIISIKLLLVTLLIIENIPILIKTAIMTYNKFLFIFFIFYSPLLFNSFSYICFNFSKAFLSSY